MPDYTKGKIYKLVSHQTDNIYIGSTCQPLCERKSKHKNAYKRFQSGKFKYITSYEIVKFDDVQIILLENCPCENREQLLARERFYIENTNNCINKHIPTRTKKEHYEDNKEKNAEKRKEYVKKNADKIKQYKVEWREQNKEKIKKNGNEVYICSCGMEVRKNYKYDHERTKIHKSKNV